MRSKSKNSDRLSWLDYKVLSISKYLFYYVSLVFKKKIFFFSKFEKTLESLKFQQFFSILGGRVREQLIFIFLKFSQGINKTFEIPCSGVSISYQAYQIHRVMGGERCKSYKDLTPVAP